MTLVAVFETTKGTIRADLYPDAAPVTVANFVNLVQRGYYDTSEAMPPIYAFEGVELHFAFPDNIPEDQKSGVLCFRANQFRIRRVADFNSNNLVEGTLKTSTSSDEPS